MYKYDKACAALRAYAAELSVGIVAPHTEEMRESLRTAGKVLQFAGFRPVVGLLAETPAKGTGNYMPEEHEIVEDLECFFELGEGAYEAALAC